MTSGKRALFGACTLAGILALAPGAFAQGGVTDSGSSSSSNSSTDTGPTNGSGFTTQSGMSGHDPCAVNSANQPGASVKTSKTGCTNTGFRGEHPGGSRTTVPENKGGTTPE